MRLFLTTLTILFFCSTNISNSTWAQPVSPQFFSSIPDVPLMHGLIEQPDQSLSFDKPEGRIVESWAAIDSKSRDEILRYYESTLPQFGWQQKNQTLYIRNAEQLRLDFESIDGHDHFRVMISPK